MQLMIWLDRSMLVVVLATAAVGKVWSPDARRDVAELIARTWPFVTGRRATRTVTVIVAAEAAAALALVSPVPVVGLAGATLLLGILAAGSAGVVARGGNAPCRCFGARSRSMSRSQVRRNTALTAAAAAGLVGECIQVTSSAAAHPASQASALLAVAMGALLGALIVTWPDLTYLLSRTVPSATPRGGTP